MFAMQEELHEGGTFSLGLISLPEMTKWVDLPLIYVPYHNSRFNFLEFPYEPAWQTGFTLHGKLVDKNGAPVSLLTRFAIVPQALEGMPADYVRELCACQAPFATPLLNGEFTLTTPVPGTFRVLVDLFDEAPSANSLLLTVKPQMTGLTVTLPAPLLEAPGGMVLRWLTKTAPAVPRTLQVSAASDKVPVYAPVNDLLAVWGSVSPTALAVWSTEGAQKGWRTLTRRAMQLTPVDTNGQPLPVAARPSLFLYPPLPESAHMNRGLSVGYQRVNMMPPIAEMAPVTFSPDYQPPFRCELLSGTYLWAVLVSTTAGARSMSRRKARRKWR